MGRPRDRDERAQRRAQEDLHKGLGRGDAERTLDSVLLLGPEARRALLPRITALLLAEVRRARAAGGHARVQRFAAALLDQGDLFGVLSEEERRELRLALLHALVRLDRAPLARTQLDALSPDLAARAPALLAWLGAYVDSDGRLGPGALAALPALPAALRGAADERLGYEPQGAMRPAAPRAPEEAEEAVCRLAATGALRELRGWLGAAAPPVRAALVRSAAPLLLREALLRARGANKTSGQPAAASGAGAPQRAAPEAALPLLSLLSAIAGEVPAEQAADLLLALRLCAAPLRAGDKDVLPVVRGLAKPLLGGERGAAVREWLTQLLPRSAGAGALPLLTDLLGSGPSFRAFGLALFIWADSAAAPDRSLPPCPGWVQEALRALLSTPGAGLAASLRRSEPRVRREILELVSLAMPRALGEQLIDRCWADVDEGLRAELAGLLLDLLEPRASERPGIPASRATFGDLRKLFEELAAQGTKAPRELRLMLMTMPSRGPLPELAWSIFEEMQDAALASAPLSGERLELFLRQRDRALPYRDEVLRIGLRLEARDAEALSLIERYQESRPGVQPLLGALRHCHELGRKKLGLAVQQRLLAAHAEDAPGLAAALLAAMSWPSVPRGLRQALSRALLAADARHGGPRTPQHGHALRYAQRLVPRPGGKAPAKKKAPPRRRLTQQRLLPEEP